MDLESVSGTRFGEAVPKPDREPDGEPARFGTQFLNRFGHGLASKAVREKGKTGHKTGSGLWSGFRRLICFQ